MKRIPLLLILSLFTAVGCDSTLSEHEADARYEAVTAAFRSARATPIASKSAGGEQEYLLEVAFDPQADLRLPEAVNVLPQAAGTATVAVWDNGQGLDAVAGDGIFTAAVPGGCIPDPGSAGKGADVGITCKIKFVPPGAECGDWGECPERVERSFLWGLIQYETDVVFCFCLVDCDIEVKK